MRTTMNIPERLLSEARRASGARTKTQAVIWGLEELKRRGLLERLWDLRGRLPLDVDPRRSRAR